MANKKTLVLGASSKPDRYAYLAVNRLRQHGHDVVAVGNREGQVADVAITQQMPDTSADIDTITLYLNPANQVDYYDKILQLQPKRIIFNPGTENAELVEMAQARGIETLDACTLVMLSTNMY